MALNIIVCIKQVPSPDHFSRITLDAERQAINRAGIPCVMNPLDKNALEEGIRIREKFGGNITALSMGPPSAREVLEEALAMGADEAVLLCDEAFARADTLATAYPLAKAIRKLGNFDMVLCGNKTIDGNTGQVGPQLAEFLKIPHIAYVRKIEFMDERNILVVRSIENGYLKIKAGFPLALAVIKEINEPRLPSAMMIMEALSKEIKTWNARDIEAEPGWLGLPGSPTRVASIYQRKSARAGILFENSPEAAVPLAVNKLKELGAFN